MGRYRKVDPRIWNDQKFRTLSDNGKLTFLFVLTHPHMTSLGAMRATEAGLAEELGWTQKAFREGLSKGLFLYDQKAACLVVPNFLKYNPPESPNVVVSWEKIVDLVPECGLQVELFQNIKAFLKGLGEGFAKAMPKTMPNPEPEPEPELKDFAPPSPSVTGGAALMFSGFFSCPYFEVDLDYRLKLAREFPALNDDLLRRELSKMEDWVADNPKKKKFKANGHLQNPKLFIKNWLDRVGGIMGPGSDKPKGLASVQRFMQNGEQNG